MILGNFKRKDVEKNFCKVCRNPFLRKTKRTGHKNPIGVRKANSKACSKKCSKILRSYRPKNMEEK